MDTEKLDLFCEIYDDDTLLKKKSVIDVMLDLQTKTKDLQSVMYAPFFGSSVENENNDIVIYDAINKLRYDRGASIEYIEKWLNEFKIDIDDILEYKFVSNEIGKFINVKYIDFKGTAEEIRKAHLIQVEFLDYFLKLYADNILKRSDPFKSISNKNEWKQIKLVGIDVEYLNDFCKSIFNESLATKSNNRSNIKELAYKLEVEINENIINTSDNKIESYLHRVIVALNERQKDILFSVDHMDKWISKFEINLDDFPDFKNEKLNIILNKKYSGSHISVEERREVFQIQSVFYFYTSLVVTNKLISFLNSRSNKQPDDINEIKNKVVKFDSKQLTVNQSVILLDKLGLFASSVFEEMSNVKKSLILSDLLGRNDKNIKKSIEMLELKTQDLTSGYQKDLSKIQQLLDSY